MSQEDRRIFNDRTGVRWTVVEVPASQGAAPFRERRAFPRMATRPPRGHQVTTRDVGVAWLRFESHGDSRRVDVYPPDWLTLSAEALGDLLAGSRRVDGN